MKRLGLKKKILLEENELTHVKIKQLRTKFRFILFSRAVSLSVVLKPDKPLAASRCGAFRGPEIDLEHSSYLQPHGRSLSLVCSFNISEAAVIGWDGLGVQGEKTEDANGGTTLLGLKYSSSLDLDSSSFHLTRVLGKGSQWWIKQSVVALLRRKI